MVKESAVNETTMSARAPEPDEPSGEHGGVLLRPARIEVIVAAVVAAVLLALVVVEPDILEAPFENARTLLFTVGGTLVAALAWVAMIRFRVAPAVRVVVLLVPFVAVNWWLLSPYFVDDVVDESFAVSIAAEQPAPAAEPAVSAAPAATVPTTPSQPTSATVAPAAPVPTVPPATTAPPAATVPSGPVLLGAGTFVGLAGHSGTGDAGIFQNPDGSLVLRFENFDIENGPDLEVYLVPGADQVSLADGSIALGALKGNVGDQNYELPAGTVLPSGSYTALVWCEAFSVEFVGATIVV